MADSGQKHTADIQNIDVTAKANGYETFHTNALDEHMNELSKPLSFETKCFSNIVETPKSHASRGGGLRNRNSSSHTHKHVTLAGTNHDSIHDIRVNNQYPTFQNGDKYKLSDNNSHIHRDSLKQSNDDCHPDNDDFFDKEKTEERTKKSTESRGMSLSGFLFEELTRGYKIEQDEEKLAEKRKRVYTFAKIPRELEKFMFYGFFQCVDAFLYLFTFLPVRFLLAGFKLLLSLIIMPWKSGRLLESAQMCDLLKGIILLSCFYLMQYVDVSMMYHIVRGQAIIKLYIFFNMLEVADKLFSSFGQDILDSLFWTATEPRGRKRDNIGMLPHLIIAIIYVFLHCLLVLFQATTLNVAFNSHNKALLTIMMSNNFVELKGSVFKKFEKNNLFQMSCSDVRERFHFMILLAIVCIRNLTEFSWKVDHLFVLLPDVFLVMISEFMVDWVKHAFITKFNDIPAEVYKEYTVSLAYDMVSSQQKTAFCDFLDVVSRRMGFIPLPIAVLLVRVAHQSIKMRSYMDFFLLTVLYVCLVLLKLTVSIVLLGLAVDYVQENKDAKEASEKAGVSVPSAPKRSASVTPLSASVRLPRIQELKRSRSFEENLTVLDNTSPEVLSQAESQTETPFSANKPMFSNSTVSLASVGLNEDYVRDKVPSAEHSRDSSPGNTLKVSKEKDKKPAKALHEVDRYTMVSNRII